MQGGDALVGDAAGDDEIEVVEVGGHVEGEAVAGDPPEMRTPIAASFSSPTTPRQAPIRPAFTPKTRPPDHHLLEVADVAMNVAAIGLQVEDRIADELPGPW